MAIVIEHNLEVDAPAEAVWEVISDMGSYKEWNPFVIDCSSTLKPGDPVDMTVRLGKQTRQEQEVMVSCNEGRGFTYAMRPPPLGALASRRSHDIEPIDENRSVYKSRFELKGWLSPIVKMAVGGSLQAGFDGMSHGIKQRAEELHAARSGS